jgi:hypothetical protein
MRPVPFLDWVTRFWTPPAAGNPGLQGCTCGPRLGCDLDATCPVSGQGDQILDTPGRREPSVCRGEPVAHALLGRSTPRQAHGFPRGKGREPTRGSAGWGWARRHGSDAHGDVAATDRGESSHASKGNRGRLRRVGRREEEEERRNSKAPTMDQGWRASQLGVGVCLASVHPPSRVRLAHGNPLQGRHPGLPGEKRLCHRGSSCRGGCRGRETASPGD